MQVLSQGFSRDRVIMIRDSINGDDSVMGEVIFRGTEGQAGTQLTASAFSEYSLYASLLFNVFQSR